MSGLVGMHGLQGLRSGHAGGGPEVYACIATGHSRTLAGNNQPFPVYPFTK